MSTSPQDMNELLKELKGLAEELRKKFSLQITLSRFLTVLYDYPCMARCLSELISRSHELIDCYYRERHEFIRRLLVNLLYIRLKEENFTVSIKAENKSDYGTGDIDIDYNQNEIGLLIDSFKLRIEVKSGISFSISQILHYLLNADAVIVCLAGRGDSITLTNSEVKPLLELQLKIALKKLNLLLEGDYTKIPGPWCTGCPLDCSYSRPNVSHEPVLENEFVAMVQKWRCAVEKAINQTIELLKKARETRLTPEISGHGFQTESRKVTEAEMCNEHHLGEASKGDFDESD